MSNKKKEAEPTEQSAQTTRQTAAEAAEVPAEAPEADQTAAVLDEARAAQAREHEQYLRLAAEYDNFRKRSAKEKDGIYQDAKAETAKKFLPVYDNLERALKNETADTAYKKGVEMTMNELVKILAALEIIPFGAAGEAFDKVARAVGLGYPGGPKVDKAAKEGNPHAMEFPRAKVADSPYDFSFSGLKSAVLNYINHAKMTGEEIYVPDLVASFQNAVVDVLVSRAITAAKEYGYKKLAIAGGVASNSALRAAMKEACDKNGITFYHPSPIFCTDNAAMIGAAAYYEYKKGNRSGWDLNAVPNLKLGER